MRSGQLFDISQSLLIFQCANFILSCFIYRSGDEEPWRSGHLFFYLADEDGNPLSLGGDTSAIQENSLLTSGSRMDVGSWQLHLKSLVNLLKHMLL